MAVLNDVTDLLTRYAAGAVPAGDAGAHFQQVAQSVDCGTLARGIAAAMRSDKTPPFSEIISQLFASGTSEQRTATLNTLLSAVPPEQRARISTLIPGRLAMYPPEAHTPERMRRPVRFSSLPGMSNSTMPASSTK